MVQLLLVLVREQHDGLSHVSYLLLCKKWLVLRHEIDSVFRGDVAVVHDREAGCVEVVPDRLDAAARNRRADRAPVKHPGEDDVVGVACRTRCLSDSILARDTSSDCFHSVKMGTVAGSGKLVDWGT